MDTELARTFLEIVSTGSFIRAAERLNVGQTTVSARIRTLEQQLGRPLFVRNKGGASLTPAGEQFLRYAPTFVQLWQRARHQVAVPPGHRAVLTVGSEVSLWQPLLLDWVLWMRRSLRDIALRVHVDVPQDLINQVAAGLVDVAIMYAPQHRPGLKIDLLMEEELVLVTTNPDARSLRRRGLRPRGLGAGLCPSPRHELSRSHTWAVRQSRPAWAELHSLGWRIRLLQDARGPAAYGVRTAPPGAGNAPILVSDLRRFTPPMRMMRYWVRLWPDCAPSQPRRSYRPTSPLPQRLQIIARLGRPSVNSANRNDSTPIHSARKAQ